MRAKAMALAVLITLGLVVAPVFPAHALSCEAGSATTLPVSAAGRPIAIYGDDVGEEPMRLLWDLGMQWNTHDFGKAIAAEQNWFGECKYPGIGLATGSGYSWRDRSVTLWVWADAVDLSIAKQSMYRLIDAVAVSTTATTTTVPQSSADWVVGFGGAKYDGSTIVQPMSDNSLIVASRHSASQANSIAVRHISASGVTGWKSSFFDGLDFKATSVEMTASTLLPGDRALFLGYAERSTLDIALMSVDAAGTSSRIVIEDSGQSFAHVITACTDGSVYIGGESQGVTTDSFVVRLSASLNVEWTRHFGAPEKNDRLLALSCNEENSVTMSAWAGGSLTGNSADDLYTFYTVEMSESGVTTKTVELEKDYGEFSPQSAVFSSDKSLYVVGESNNYYREMSCTEKAIGGSFVSKYAASGLLEWRKILPCGNLNRKAVTNSTGDIIVVGTASSVRVAGQQKFGGDDFLLHKYSIDGVLVSTQQFGSAADDVASSLALDAFDNVYIGGYVKGSFGGHVNAGDWDAVVIKRHAANTPAPTATTTTTEPEPTTTTVTPVVVATTTQAPEPESIAVVQVLDEPVSFPPTTTTTTTTIAPANAAPIFSAAVRAVKITSPAVQKKVAKKIVKKKVVKKKVKVRIK